MKELLLEDFSKTHKEKRNAYSVINDYIHSEECYDGTVFAIHGLRRTGKTTIMEQLMLDNKDSIGCMFLLAEEKDRMDMLYEKLDEALERKVKCVFIDEVTFIDDFIDDSSLLSNYYAKEGLRIILAGTDSLSLMFAEDRELFGRVKHISTTYIPFEEHCRVLKTNDMDNYIEYGGLMKKGARREDHEIYDLTSTRKYLDEAVSQNITRSLKNYIEYSGNRRLKAVTNEEMRTVIEKLVEKYSGVFSLEAFNEALKKITLSAPSDTKDFKDLEGKEMFSLLKAKKQEIISEFVKLINADTVITHPFDEDMVEEIENILINLDFLSATTKVELSYTDELGWRSSKPEREFYIIQPAIKYYHLLQAKEFIETNDIYNNLSEKGKTFIKDKLEGQIRGDMTEQIVLFEVSRTLPLSKYIVCKPCFKMYGKAVGEYDMLIYDKQEDRYWGFEIKHTGNPYHKQYQHLENEAFTAVLDAKYGHRENVCVLYSGTSFTTNDGILYLNLSDFIKTVTLQRDVEKAIAVLNKYLIPQT